jgi:hypothetical protein
MITDEIIRDCLAVYTVCGQQMAWRWQQSSRFIGSQERLDLIFSLSPENRAGAIKQPATWFQNGPQRFQQLGLNDSQLGDVRLPAQPANIWVAPHNA